VTWRDDYPAFLAVVESRLDAGALEYGDRSLSAHPATLLRELAEEAADMACWGYLLHRRCQRLLVALERSEDGGR
jgi:hypothetical protein